MTGDRGVQKRRAELRADAEILLQAIAELAPSDRDPYTDPDTLARAVEIGLLDAPHLRGNAAACGKIVTRMIGGACMAIDRSTGQPLAERERVARALVKNSLTWEPNTERTEKKRRLVQIRVG